ncbi:MAG: protein kinase [Acidobacteria bacterium]|nr:protein kinase [Acidobacteriota bacterium]
MAITAGKRLGPYEILSQIGAGGMGEVYKARDTRLDRIVAIKVLPPHLANNGEARERFEREARTIGQLNHPHICTLHDIGEQDGIHYLVMEYLDGENLHQRLQKGPLPLEQVLQYATEIIDALDAAHRHGATHRDIKPGNIMIVDHCQAKITDFGLARLAHSELQTLTRPGRAMGTPLYMSPEQIQGGDLDGRSDIFSLGTVFFEMLTQQRLFKSDNVTAVILKILSDPPPAIHDFRPDLPAAVDTVIRRMLAKDRKDRYPSAEALCNDLVTTGLLATPIGGMTRSGAAARRALGEATSTNPLPLAPPDLPELPANDSATETHRPQEGAQPSPPWAASGAPPVRRPRMVFAPLAVAALVTLVAVPTYLGFTYAQRAGLLPWARGDKTTADPGIRPLSREASTLVEAANTALLRGRGAAEARALFGKAALLAPDNPIPEVGLAYCDLGDGKAAAGHERLLHLLARYPGSAEVLVGLGFSEERQKNDAAALKYYEAAIRLKAELLDAHMRIASIYYRKNELLNAKHAFEEARRIAPNSPDVVFNLAHVYAKLGDLERARELLEMATRDFPADLEIATQLGRIYAMKGDVGAAEAQYRRVLSSGGAVGPAAYRELANLLQSQDRFAEALEVLRTFRSRLPEPSSESSVEAQMHELEARLKQ